MAAKKKSVANVERKAGATRAKAQAFTAEEREAMKARVRETKKPGGADGEKDVLAAIAKMPPSDRALGERLHALVRAHAPSLVPRLWYGMPAYSRDGKVVCFFQAASKFKVRYATFGFQPDAKLDDGAAWPVAFAVTKLGAAEEARIAALLERA